MLKYYKFFILTITVVLAIFIFLVILFKPSEVSYSGPAEAILVVEKKEPPKHIKTPDKVRAIYMTSCAAGSRSYREALTELIESTELNSIVIDVKDYTGKISFPAKDLLFNTSGYQGCFVGDMEDFIKSLHEKGVYVIARVTVFQDPIVPKIDSSIAVLKNSNRLELWSDHKKINYVDPGSQKFWEYISKIGEESYRIGFDEINFDYIRFPSDGNMKDIYFPISHGKSKKEVLRSFFEFLKLRFPPQGIPISADLFGMTTTNYDDLNIGQVLEDALNNFDYVSPMVYPSHYPPTWNGLDNPNKYPYETVLYSMQKAVERANLASTTPLKIRPWLQDFSIYGVEYTAEMVRKQMQAVYDAGLDSWMLWDPSNKYTKDALLSM